MILLCQSKLNVCFLVDVPFYSKKLKPLNKTT
ncbi:MAG: hypothetical protein ACI9JY_002975, partial [Saprospiraceae bacterium]